MLLVRAFEEEDAEGRILSAHARSRATEAARAEGVGGGDDDERFLTRRAAALMEGVEERAPGVRGLLRGTRLGAGLGPAVLLVAASVGLLTNALGPHRAVNVLAAPMVVIVAWNLGLFVVLALLSLRRGRRPRTPRATGFVAALQRRAARLPLGSGARDGAVTAGAVSRYLALWQPVGAPLLAARVRRLLHLGALALAAGAVGGMYVRGLVLAYEATWESTFLQAGAVQSLLDVVLGPAAAVLGTAVPDVAPLQAPASGPAATWIHLWAVTAALLVVLPRLVLAIVETRRLGALAGSVPVDLGAGYFRRLLAPARGDASDVLVRPYSVHPGRREQDTLRAILHDLFGARAAVRWDEPLDYGAEAGDDDGPVAAPGGATDAAPDAAPDGASRCRVALFGLAQSPESEVHGAWLGALREAARARGPDEHLLVVVDATAFRQRFGDGPRVDERRRAWDRVVREAGLTAVHVDLGRPMQGDLLSELAGALWPPADGSAGASAGVSPAPGPAR